MLGEEEIQEIEAEAAHYEDRRAVSVDALKIVQQRRGWVDDDTLVEVAEVLGMSPAELEGVATFYNLIYRQPVGRHVIHVCDSVSCWIRGYDELRDNLRARLGIEYGQTTEDGRFTLLPTVCLGLCDRAPALMIDREVKGPIDDQALDELLDAAD